MNSPFQRAANAAKPLAPVILTLFTLYTIGLVAGVLLFLHALQSAAEEDLAERVSIALGIETTRQETTLEEYSYWDEAYASTITNVDRDWLEKNVGRYLVERDGYDFTLAAARGTDMTFMVTPDDATPPSFADLLDGGLQQLMERCRANATFAHIESAYLALPDGVYLVTAGPFIDESSTTVRPEYSFLVFGRKLDADLLDDVAATYRLPGLRLARSEAEGLLPLPGVRGRTVAALAWTTPPAGGGMLAEILAVVVAFFLLASALTWRILAREQAQRGRHEKELSRAKDDAELANRSKSVFLARMSHDLRAPVNGIMGMLQLLHMESLSLKQGSYVKMALGSCRQLTELLRDVLDLSKIEANRLEITKAPFNLHGRLDELRNLFLPTAREKALRFEVAVAPEVPDSLYGDEQRLTQVLTNLLGNAFKFTETGGVRLDVGLTHRHPRLTHLLFMVSDSGSGIDDARMDMLFEPFTQAAPDASEAGVGLGLAIVKRLVGLMGGDLCLESAPGQGTTFYLHLAFPAQAQAIEMMVRGENEPATLPGPFHALIVDDDRVHLIVLEDMLRKLGVRVDVARNGRAALDAIRATAYDLVFLDIHIPEVDGVKVARTVRTAREFAHRADVPLVAITSDAMVGDRERYLAGGMDDYLSKPVELEQLKRVVFALYESRRPDGS